MYSNNRLFFKCTLDRLIFFLYLDFEAVFNNALS